MIEVAVKANGISCIDQDAIGNERRWLEILAKYPHPNILVVYGIVVDASDGGVRIVMQYCAGGSLEKFLAHTQRASDGREVRIKLFV